MYDLLLANYEATERTRIAAQRYADILIAISDNKITTYEVEALASKWGITTQEVLKYVAKVLNVPKINGWDFEGLLAAEGWEAALKALNEYLKMLAAMKKPELPVPYTPTYYSDLAKTLVGTPGYTGMTVGQIEAERMRESGNRFSGPKMAEGGIVTKATTALIGEAGPEAVIPLSKMGGMGTTVNITVNGSVTSASDLTEFVRNGILAGQTSGKAITSSVVNL
jgi:hypothetical protein